MSVNLLASLRLYLVTDQKNLRGRSLTDVVLSAVQGGVTCVQLREKDLCSRDFVALARAMKDLLAPTGVPLVINDRIDVALACGAQGVHLGQSDMPVALARQLLPPEVFIGLSVESLDDVVRAAGQAVDYLGVSPIYATPTKTDTAAPWGLAGLRQVRAMTALPLVAIGGVHVTNAAEVLLAGADGLAVVSAICSAPDPSAAAQSFGWLFQPFSEDERSDPIRYP
ncbi:MAG: thiamine phosphate synthase [Rhodoferax sp.]|uniref:thiamine phosphate synthase n=1 Tax=Rhodoferax sp. TaxID=50421 RepID=UPI002629C184|nr:thiamine phosphate synthase [Rhodoferax sp.]MDD2879340.1 thiamine phosphate synthase [Rhodoferax sp.]